MRRFESGWQKTLNKRKRDEGAKVGARTLFEVGIKKKSRQDQVPGTHHNLENSEDRNQDARVEEITELSSVLNPEQNAEAQPPSQQSNSNIERSSSSDRYHDSSQPTLLSSSSTTINNPTTARQIVVENCPNGKYLTYFSFSSIRHNAILDF